MPELINGEWWFWDETWTEAIGPYECEWDARVAMNSYGDFLNYGPPEVC